MVETTSDPARALKWYFRINRDNLKTILVYDNAGAAKNLSGYTPVLNFKKREEDSTNFLQLAIGSGITVNGTGRWDVAMTKTQASKFRDQTYYLELVITQGALERNWIAGDAVFHNGRFDGVSTDTSSLTVYDAGGTVSITLTESSTGGTGDVVGPASSVNNNIPVFSGTTGKLLDDGGKTIATITAEDTKAVLVFCHNTVGQTITNQPVGETFFISATRSILKFDSTRYTRARLMVNVGTGSASVNSPRLYAKYKSTYTNGDAVGTFTTLGSGSGSETCSMTNIAVVVSDWITLPAGAIGDVFWTLAQIGGDGAADPVINQAFLEFDV